MICEQYRNGVMALLDGELSDAERPEIETHLHQCPDCRTEYQRYRRLLDLSRQLPPDSPCELQFQGYWAGVCRKLESKASWLNWNIAGVTLCLVGVLMVFGFTGQLLERTLGGIALLAGGCLFALKHLCDTSS